MRIKTLVIGVVAVVVVGVVVANLFRIGLSAQSDDGRANPSSTSQSLTDTAPQKKELESVDDELAERLKTICERAGGIVGVAVTHVETNQSVAIQGAARLPLYSVFKLPLAVSVLKDVEENRLRLDRKVRVTPADVAPGWQGNTDLWRKPVELTVEQLLELSIVRSDNTSSDKLLQLVGGPAAVTGRMRSLGFPDIDIRVSVREFAAQPENPNTGTAPDLARLLAQLKKGEILQPPQLALLLGFMERTTIGARRLRGDLPRGTPVADKTGTGETTTNDVGLITLPKGKGHLAMAVLINGSKLPAEAQEKLIAELARVAYDAHITRVAQGKQ